MPQDSQEEERSEEPYEPTFRNTFDGQENTEEVEEKGDYGMQTPSTGTPSGSDGVASLEVFLNAVENDPDLPVNQDLAIKSYHYLCSKMKDWGLEVKADGQIGPKEKEAAPKEEKQEEPAPSGEQAGIARWEKWYEDWDSSEASTQNGGWSSPEPLESIIARMEPGEEALSVACMYEINQDKKRRREEKREEKREVAQEGAQACHQNLVVPCDASRPQTDSKPVRWTPLTKHGFYTFLAACGQGGKSIMDMDLKGFIEYAVNADLANLPNDLAQEVAASIRYVSELHYSWLVHDPDDVAWWLDQGSLGCIDHS